MHSVLFQRLARKGVHALAGTSTVTALKPAMLHAKSARFIASAKPKGSSSDREEDFISEDVEHVDDEEAPSSRSVIVDEDATWGQRALECAQEVLSASDDLSLYAFRAVVNTKSVDIRLDKLSDTYGSPTLDEIGAFSRDFNERFEAMVGEEEAGSIEVEVSSPGATRQVKIPEELERFRGLPMEVVTVQEPDVRVMVFKGFVEGEDGEGGEGGEDGDSKWMYADVKANRSLNKGRGLNKKAREAVFVLRAEDISGCHLHIDL